ncbi:hypothetical protein GCL60_02855 [Silvanigrella paludirubra]|uniref:Uncharacterized protein n=1 Tax=Silvanigrella paludirubra TaxID=2499159 RepID=A0A6N6VW57_9BACT|nr:hypothetical protein [Silvanigrella paludirubra]KAB8040885.1 hypothetical protein GCL60_02855 [Silvanigrella paludirubra]
MQKYSNRRQHINILILIFLCLTHFKIMASQPYGDSLSLENFFLEKKYFPQVFGTKYERPKIPLYDVYNDSNENNLYKTFPIELKCIYKSNCFVNLQTGESQGDFKIRGFVKRNYGQRRVFNILIKMFKNNKKLKLNNTTIIFHHPNGMQIINNYQGVIASPLLAIDFNKPILYLNFPIEKNLYYQVCNIDYGYCNEKKQLFDYFLSNNFIHYLKFWKLNDYKQLGANASISYTKTFQKNKTIVDAQTYEYTVAGKLGYKKNIKIGDNMSDYSAEVNLQFKYGFTRAISQLTSESSTYTVNFMSRNNKPMAGAEYILYKGIYLEYPFVDNFIDDLNQFIHFKDEFKFTKIHSFEDMNPNSEYKFKWITSGSADLEIDNLNENKDRFKVTNWTPTVSLER